MDAGTVVEGSGIPFEPAFQRNTLQPNSGWRPETCHHSAAVTGALRSTPISLRGTGTRHPSVVLRAPSRRECGLCHGIFPGQNCLRRTTFWLRRRDSNPRPRVMSPLRYLCATPLFKDP